jgi:MtN3 and saliva related transmembrane protein
MLSPSMINGLGYVAAVLTTISFVPQVMLTLRTRDVSGISLLMYSCFTVGVGLWLLYGLSLGNWPIVVANAITFSLALSILVMKVLSLLPGSRFAAASTHTER